MTKYYTRACNFYYGNNAKFLIKKKQLYHYVEINTSHLIKLKLLQEKKINSKILILKNINNLKKKFKKKN